MIIFLQSTNGERETHCDLSLQSHVQIANAYQRPDEQYKILDDGKTGDCVSDCIHVEAFRANIEMPVAVYRITRENGNEIENPTTHDDEAHDNVGYVTCPLVRKDFDVEQADRDFDRSQNDDVSSCRDPDYAYR